MKTQSIELIDSNFVAAPLPGEAAPAPAASRCPFHKALGSIRAAFTPKPADTSAASTFVALSKFVIANDKNLRACFGPAHDFVRQSSGRQHYRFRPD